MSYLYTRAVVDRDLVPLLGKARWKKTGKGDEVLECCSCFRPDNNPSLVVWPSLPDGSGGNCVDQSTGEKFKVSDMYRVLGVPDPYFEGKEQALPVPPVDPKARMLWESAQPATSHFYADWKNVPLDGLRVAPNGELLIPQRDPRDGQIVGVERIEPRKPRDKDDKTKKQVNPRGGIFQIGSTDGEQPILISEGVSTGYALHRLTGWPVFVAFSAGQLAAMYQTVRYLHPGREIAVAPDYD
ncbi:MAG: hypothetical protein EOM17_17135, partial [Synergistales bacterium]|nr:hypothetical protein [Synergistales bacterium]